MCTMIFQMTDQSVKIMSLSDVVWRRDGWLSRGWALVMRLPLVGKLGGWQQPYESQEVQAPKDTRQWTCIGTCRTARKEIHKTIQEKFLPDGLGRRVRSRCAYREYGEKES